MDRPNSALERTSARYSASLESKEHRAAEAAQLLTLGHDDMARAERGMKL